MRDSESGSRSGIEEGGLMEHIMRDYCMIRRAKSNADIIAVVAARWSLADSQDQFSQPPYRVRN
jgi:hypothetical protein